MSNRKIGAVDYIAYALSAMVYILPQYLLSSYLSPYYTDVALVSGGVVGVIVLAMRITDGISDLLMGRIIDRTESKLGKARPWLLVGTIGLTVTLFAVFHVPASASDSVKAVWLALTYFLVMTIFGTVQGVSSNTIIVYLTDDTEARNKLGASNMLGVYIGGAIATTVTALLLGKLGYTQEGYDKTMLMYAAVVFAAGIFSFIRLKETISPSMPKGSSGMPIKKILSTMVRNRYYMCVVIAGLLINLTNGITTGMGIYFCRDVFGNADLYAIVTVVLIAPTIVGLPFAVMISKKTGSQKTLVYGRIGYMIAAVIQGAGLVAVNLPVFFTGVALCGLFGASFAACFTARIANTCEYHELKYHTNATGTMMSATSFCNKVGLGLGAAVTGILLEAAKYDGSLVSQGIAQSDFTVNVEKWTVAVIPFVLNIIITLCLWKSDVEPSLKSIKITEN